MGLTLTRPFVDITWVTLVLVLTLVVSNSEQPYLCDIASRIDTKQTYQNPVNNGICLKCPPGSRLAQNEKHCSSPNKVDHCQCCPLETYQSSYTGQATSCTPCQVRRKDEVETQPCNGTHNRRCVCRRGLYYIKGADACMPHKTCPEGMGVFTLGTELDDTVCEDCQGDKTFSNVSSPSEPCRPCTVCGDGEKTEQKCTAESDTVCVQEQDNTGWILMIVLPVVGGVVVVGVLIGCLIRKCRHVHEDDKNLTSNIDREPGASGISDGAVNVDQSRHEEVFRKLFLIISESLSREWKNFIRHLKWGDCKVDGIISRAECENTASLSNQIYSCLTTYRSQFPSKTPSEFVWEIDQDRYGDIKDKLQHELDLEESSTA